MIIIYCKIKKYIIIESWHTNCHKFKEKKKVYQAERNKGVGCTIYIN